MKKEVRTFRNFVSKLAAAAMLAVLCLSFPLAAFAEEKSEITFNREDDIKLNGDYYRLDLLGNSASGEWQQMVCDSVPFQLPEEGVVLLLRCTKLGSPLEPKDLSDVTDAFQLYNIETDTFLLPVGLITVEKEPNDYSKPGSSFDVLFYDEQYAGDSGYALACGEEIYSFDRMGRFSPYRYPLRTRTAELSELPPMPEPGTVSGDQRPEYASALEQILEKSDQHEYTALNQEVQEIGNTVLAVFSSYGTLTDCTLDEDSEDSIFRDFAQDQFAERLEDADSVILVHSRRERAGQYGINGGAAWRVYTLITVVRPDTMEEYNTITVSVSDPPESIRTNGLYSAGAEGNYEPEKAIEYLLEMMRQQ